jgi:hypothetical protein
MPGVTTFRQKFVGRTAAVGAGAGHPNVGAGDEDAAIDDDDDDTTAELVMSALLLDAVDEIAEEEIDETMSEDEETTVELGLGRVLLGVGDGVEDDSDELVIAMLLLETALDELTVLDKLAMLDDIAEL